MNSNAQPNLQALLEQLGAEEVPIDLRHRHALRRALLNSGYFAPPRRFSLAWMFRHAGTFAVGGATVAVVVVSFQIVTAFAPTGQGSASRPLADAVVGPTLPEALATAAETPAPVAERPAAAKSPLEYLDVADLPRVVPASVINFVQPRQEAMQR